MIDASRSWAISGSWKADRAAPAASPAGAPESRSIRVGPAAGPTPSRTAGPAHDRPGLAEGCEPLHLLPRGLGVDGHHRGPEAGAGHVGDDPFRTVLPGQHDPVAQGEAEGLPAAGPFLHPLQELGVGDSVPAAFAAGLEGGSPRVPGAGPAQQVRQGGDLPLGPEPLLLDPRLPGRLGQPGFGSALLAQDVAPQPGQVDVGHVRGPVDGGHVHVEGAALLRRQRLVQGPGAGRLEAAVEMGVRVVEVDVVEHALQPDLGGPQKPPLTRRGGPAGQVEEPLPELDGTEVPQPEDGPEQAHARVAPIGKRRFIPIAVGHGRPQEVSPDAVEEGAEAHRVLRARRHLEDLDRVGPRPHRGRDRGVHHPVHRNQVEDDLRPRGEVRQQAASIGHHQGVHHLQPRDPARFRVGEAALDDAGPHDHQGYVPPAQGEHLFAQGLRVGVDVVPAVLAGPAHALRHEPPLYPSRPPVLDELLEAGARQLAVPRPPVLPCDLALEPPREILRGGLFPQTAAGRPAVGHLAHRIEAAAAAVDDLAHVAVDGKGLVGDPPLAPPVHVGGGDVHEVDVPLRGPGDLHQGQGPGDVGLHRHVQRLVEDDGCGAVEDRVHLGHHLLPVL